MLKKEISNGKYDIECIFYYQDFLYIFEIIYLKIIDYYYNDLLAGHFKIGKIIKLVAKKYFWLNLDQDIKADIKNCNIYLTLKIVCYKLIDFSNHC